MSRQGLAKHWKLGYGIAKLRPATAKHGMQGRGKALGSAAMAESRYAKLRRGSAMMCSGMGMR